MTVLAAEAEVAAEYTSTGDAIQDILRDGRFQGALHTISGITEFIDIWFIRIISIISFFIISAALLKNACAGAYCANSKFWDKVADAHQKNEAISIATATQYFTGGGFKQTTAGGLRDFLLGIIPNIKAFTDFDDADIEPKAYFMKAIPQMIACVIIGVFIYNGFYRDTAAKVGEMGSVLVTRTLNAVNPESIVNSIFDSTSWPAFPWEGDKSEEGKGYLKIADELKSLVASNFSDVKTADAKANVVGNIVSSINNGRSSIAWSEAGEGYIYKISNVSSYVSAATNIENLTLGCNAVNGTPGSTDINYVWVFAMHTDEGAIVPATVDKTTANQHGYVSFTLKREVAKAGVQQLSGVNSSVSTEASQTQLDSIVPAVVAGTTFAEVKAGECKALGGSIPISAFGITDPTGITFKSTMGAGVVYNHALGVIEFTTGTPLGKAAVDAEGYNTVEIGYFCPSNSNVKKDTWLAKVRFK